MILECIYVLFVIGTTIALAFERDDIALTLSLIYIGINRAEILMRTQHKNKEIEDDSIHLDIIGIGPPHCYSWQAGNRTITAHGTDASIEEIKTIVEKVVNS